MPAMIDRGRRGCLVAGAAALLMLVGCGGGNGEGDKAHINASSGSTHGAFPDERVGISPPAAKQADLAKAAKKAGCYLVDKGSARLFADPPITGRHVAPPHQQADGAYLIPLKEDATLASLDHGRMTIQYAPDLAEEVQRELKGLFDTMYGGTLLFPNETMNYAIAASTWGHALDCTAYGGAATLDAIRAFGKANWGKYGSGSVKQFPVEGPTPADPEEPGKAGSG